MILLVHVLPEGLKELDRKLRQRHPEIVNWLGVGVIRDVWPWKFCEGTRESLHSSVGGPEAGWTPHPNYDDVSLIR